MFMKKIRTVGVYTIRFIIGIVAAIVLVAIYTKYFDNTSMILGDDGRKCISSEGSPPDLIIVNCTSFLASGRANAYWAGGALRSRGLAYLAIRKCDEALQDANLEIELRGASPDYFLKAQASYLCSGDIDTAFIYVSAMINERPKCFDTQHVYEVRSEFWKAKGREKEAADDLLRAESVKNFSILSADYFTCIWPTISPLFTAARS
jgi:hypothetical protein